MRRAPWRFIRRAPPAPGCTGAGSAGSCGVPLGPTLAATLLGGFAGALLLLATPDRAFDRVLPWLLLPRR